MKAVLLSAGLVLALSACAPTGHGGDYTEENFNVICLNSVQYWIRGDIHQGYMATKIDPKTLLPATCKPKYAEGCTKTGNVLTCPLPE